MTSTSGTETANPLLKVTGLNVSYQLDGRTQHAVRDVSFEVHPGEVVALVGESGSGKTTTAHSLINLLPANARRESGTVMFNGANLTRLTAKEWRTVRGKEIGLIPQDPTSSLDPLQRVGDQVAEALTIHRIEPKKSARESAVRLLQESGIREAATRARQHPHQFSGGMRQRALIATALATRPKLVIADEPTSALDVTVQRQILDNLAALTTERGTSVLLITHDLAVAADRADRIIVMKNGSIVEQGSADQVFNNPKDEYTKELIDAVPGLNPVRFRTASVLPLRGETDTPTHPLVEATLLEKSFPLPRIDAGPHTFKAVDGVSLTIGRRETLALVGESGSGKTTVARLLLRLEKPSNGTIIFDGVDLASAKGERLRQLRRRFQAVFQNPYASLDPRLSVEDIIAEPLRAFAQGTRAERKQRVAELLEAVQLPAFHADRRSVELSGGQRQRVAIARALALKPDLVVLDEAVSALDVSVQAQILTLLVELQEREGLSYLFISHDLAVVQQISDRVAVMRAGKLIEAGDTELVMKSPSQEYTRQLIEAIPGQRTTTAA